MPGETRTDGDRVVDGCRELLASHDAYEPDGYWSVALCAIDAVWSIGVRYGGVGKVIERYCAHVGLESRRARCYDPGVPHGPLEFFRSCGDLDDEALADGVFGNRQRTSTTNGILKAEACLRVMQVLGDAGVQTSADLAECAHDVEVKNAWRSVPGQRSGISWRYLLMNGGVQEVKPDRMICRFVADAVGREVSADEAAALLTAAAGVLGESVDGLTVLGLDHLVWRHQSGRLARSEPLRRFEGGMT